MWNSLTCAPGEIADEGKAVTQTPKTPAVIFAEPGRATIEEVDLPEMGPADVLIEVEYTSISIGTERWCLTGQMNLPDKGPLAFPHVPGYQAAGTVRRAGRDVCVTKPGDRVFSRNCRQHCDWAGSWWGGHVGLHVAQYESVIRLPEAVSTYEASSLLVAQVGFNGASKPRVSSGDVAVVIGAGLVGQYAAQVLRHRGAHVVVADLLAGRLETAARYSADDTFNSTEGDLCAFIHEKRPEGVDVVLETAGSSKTVRMGIDLLRNGGQLVLNGFYPESQSKLDWHWLRTKEITTYCPNSRTRQRLESTLRLIEQNHIEVKELVTHEFRSSRATEAYRMLLDPATEFLGIVLNWCES